MPSTIDTSYDPFETKAFSQMSPNRTMVCDQLFMRECYAEMKVVEHD